MDWSNVVYAAIGGGVGALAGSLIGAAFKGRAGRVVALVLTVVGAVIGPQVARPILEPYIGDQVHSLIGADRRADVQVGRALDKLHANPLFQALMDREPDFEGQARAAIADALKADLSSSELVVRISDWARGVGLARLPHYLMRGRNQDIVETTSQIADALIALQTISPPTCYRWMFGGYGSDPEDAGNLSRALGPDGVSRLSETMGRLIRNSSDEIPAYDEAAAQAAVVEAGKGLYSRLGPDRMAFVSGVKKATDPEDQAAVCGAMGAMYREFLSLDNAADVMRHIYRQVG